MSFAGGSIAVGPAGEVIARAGETEEILYADLDFKMNTEARRLRPYLGLRRLETFDR